MIFETDKHHWIPQWRGSFRAARISALSATNVASSRFARNGGAALELPEFVLVVAGEGEDGLPAMEGQL